MYQTAPRSWKQEYSLISSVSEDMALKQVEESRFAYDTFMGEQTEALQLEDTSGVK